LGCRVLGAFAVQKADLDADFMAVGKLSSWIHLVTSQSIRCEGQAAARCTSDCTLV
jgi:hypothetical protein